MTQVVGFEVNLFALSLEFLVIVRIFITSMGNACKNNRLIFFRKKKNLD